MSSFHNPSGGTRTIPTTFGSSSPSIPSSAPRSSRDTANYLLSSGRKPAPNPINNSTYETPSGTHNFSTPSRQGGFGGSGTPYPSSYSGGVGARSSPSVAFNERLRVATGGGSAGRAGEGQGRELRPYGTPNSGMRGTLRGGFRLTPGGVGGTPGGHGMGRSQTPSRMPPNKSLLDTGPPSVMSLKTPSSGGTRSIQGSPMLSTPFRTPLRPDTPGASGIQASGRWVTVFGFSAPLENIVLKDLRRHGNVVRTMRGKGNWMHVMYGDQRSAEMAIYKGVRIIGGVMIGVISCTEPEVVRQAENDAEKAILVASPGGSTTSTPQDVGRFGTSIMRSSVRASPGLRTPASVRRDIQMNGVQTPQPQRGILSSLSEYVFGS